MLPNLSQFAYRADLLRMKASGNLPQFTWRDAIYACTVSCNHWPTEKLALPLAEDGDLAGYQTPIGDLWWTKRLRRYTGLMALEHMRGVYERGSVLIRPGDVVLDLGGHIGSFTRYAFTRGAQTVVMFEPNLEHIQCVEHCFSEEIRAKRLHLIRAAAWNEPTRLRFAPDGIVSRVCGEGALEVEAATVDEVFESLKLRRLDFIKADIEGAEPVALDGARKTIRKFQPRMAICTYHQRDHPVLIPAIVQSIAAYDVSFNTGRNQAFFVPRVAA
jgi:FkbM family methyltransferase